MTEYADIVFTRHQGQAITVDTAPTRARVQLRVLTDRYAYLHMPTPDTVVFADQVVYRITGYDTVARALELELVEDWRPADTPPAPEPAVEYEKLKARWQEAHPNGQATQAVTEVKAEESGPA